MRALLGGVRRIRGVLSIAPHQMRPGDFLQYEGEEIADVGFPFRAGPDTPLRRTIVTVSGRHIIKREGELCRVLRE